MGPAPQMRTRFPRDTPARLVAFITSQEYLGLIPASMHANSKWLHKSTFFQTDIVWEFVAVVGRVSIVPVTKIIGVLKNPELGAPGQISMDRWSCAELHVDAQVIRLES